MAPWLLYEAGCLMMSAKPGCVVPLLIELEPAEVKLPLAQLQAVTADREGALRLLESINEANEVKLSADRLRKAFDKWWPDLASQLAAPIKSHVDDGISIVTVQSKLLADSEVNAFRDKVSMLIEQGQARVVIDLTAMTYASSSALGALFACLRRARAKGGDVYLASVPTTIQQVIKIQRLDKLFNCFDDVPQAVASFRQQPLN